MWCNSYEMLSFRLKIQCYNNPSNSAFSPVAPMQDLSTLKEQHREQKLLPQLLQFLWNTKRYSVKAGARKRHLNISPNLVTFFTLTLFFSTENTALQLEQFPLVKGVRKRKSITVWNQKQIEGYDIRTASGRFFLYHGDREKNSGWVRADWPVLVVG